MKKITRANIMGELVDKFRLQEFESENFLFSERVTPTYDIGAHVKHWETKRARQAAAANGVIYFHQIPAGVRWHVRKIDIFNETGGNFDIDQVFLYESATEAQYLFYDTTTPIANGTVNVFALPQDIVMERPRLFSVAINVSNFVAGGYITVNMYREAEVLL